jgi:dolichol-phosphate mannosyltransferase
MTAPSSLASLASLSLILPTLNERENVERFVPVLLAAIAGVVEVLVVDDGSTDGTQEATLRLAEADARVKLLRRTGAPSLTRSIEEGIARASGDLVGWLDADLVISPADYARLVSEVRGGADVAIGSRFAPGGRIKGQENDGWLGRLLALRNLRTTEDSVLGVLLSWSLNSVLLPPIVGAGVRDYTSGIIVARRSVLEGRRLEGHHGEYFIGLFAMLLADRCTLVEVPYRVLPRRFGKSKTGQNLADYFGRGRRYLAAGVAARAILRAAGTAGPPTGPGARAASSAAKRASR